MLLTYQEWVANLYTISLQFNFEKALILPVRCRGGALFLISCQFESNKLSFFQFFLERFNFYFSRKCGNLTLDVLVIIRKLLVAGS